jgi:hypothetical protein
LEALLLLVSKEGKRELELGEERALLVGYCAIILNE